MKYYPEIAPMTRERHELFDEYYAKYSRSITSAANYFAGRYRQTPDYYTGFLLLKFNQCLYTFDPSRKVSFPTYFVTSAKLTIRSHFFRYDSESSQLEDFHVNQRKVGTPETLQLESNVEVLDNAMARESIQSDPEFWELLEKKLDELEFEIIYSSFVTGISMVTLSRKVKIPSKRLRVLRLRTMKKIKTLIQSGELSYVA